MLISSWNVNSVRARIENIKSYLLKYKPDVLMMQEIKTEDVNFPYDEFSSMDYSISVSLKRRSIFRNGLTIKPSLTFK